MGRTVEATEANEAVRNVAAAVYNLTLPEVDRTLARRELRGSLGNIRAGFPQAPPHPRISKVGIKQKTRPEVSLPDALGFVYSA